LTTPDYPQSKVLAFVNGTLVDGTGANPVIDSVLLIQGDLILAAGDSGHILVPKRTQLVDVKGATLIQKNDPLTQS
jgi:predicted amidohydrolase YtcJ